jgi:hypothetical protein
MRLHFRAIKVLNYYPNMQSLGTHSRLSFLKYLARARRYVDWEIQASLRHGETVTPNGLLGIVLPSVASNPIPPERLKINLPTKNKPEAYAQWYVYPSSKNSLVEMIEQAYIARTTKAHLIENPRENLLTIKPANWRPETRLVGKVLK